MCMTCCEIPKNISKKVKFEMPNYNCLNKHYPNINLVYDSPNVMHFWSKITFCCPRWYAQPCWEHQSLAEPGSTAQINYTMEISVHHLSSKWAVAMLRRTTGTTVTLTGTTCLTEVRTLTRWALSHWSLRAALGIVSP